MPLGWAGDCQIRRTEVVRTSGNRIPTGGPGTAAKQPTDFFFRIQIFSVVHPKLSYAKKNSYHRPTSSPGWAESSAVHLRSVWKPEPGSRKAHTSPSQSAGCCGRRSLPPSRNGLRCPSPSPYTPPDQEMSKECQIKVTLRMEKDTIIFTHKYKSIDDE